MIKQTHVPNAAVFFDAFLWFGYVAFIYWLSAQPKLPAPMWFSWHDKLYHSGAYFIFGALAWRSLRHCPLNLRQQLLLSLAVSSLYGISDEWHQVFVPGRSPSVGDWLADTIGAAAAIMAIKFSMRPYRGQGIAHRLRFLD